MRAVKEYGVKQLLVAGGVSANTGIRDKLKELCDEAGIELLVPEFKYCTDNAAMIGAAAYKMYKKNEFADLSLKIVPTGELKYIK
jgi:N6-L-threonylcarbamoyladenine synthase